jgi:nucleoside-diphosphate-sugar epimerase
MKVLVTGANGFLGSHLVDLLCDLPGVQVRVLVRPTSDLQNIQDRPVERVLGDVSLSPEVLSRILDGVDRVFHLAGLTKALDQQAFFKVNAGGTENLLKACLRSGRPPSRFVLVSSAGAMGPSATDAPLTEETEARPVEAYGRSKLEAERIARSYQDRLSIAIARPAAIFGPRDPEMLPVFKTVRFGLAPRLGLGRNRYNLGHVRDIARSLLLAGTEPAAHGQIFLVGGQNITQGDLNRAIARTLGRRLLVPLAVPGPLVRLAALGSSIAGRITRKPRIFTLDNAGRLLARNWSLDLSKAERLLGYRPEFDLPRGVADTVRWYRQQGWL